ncbi:uncharacterized protein [Centruroides vittatus]|uniref:uncharacterized protein n=1 Tax=Centruroides vittatus TaxID=120091 RepID=UPI00350FAF3F
MESKNRFTFLVIVAVMAILYQLEVKQNKWVTSKSILLKSKVDDAFSFITTVDYMRKWFPFASYVKEADDRPLDIGKKYYAIYEIPIWGEYAVVYKVVDYSSKRRIVVESDIFLRPRVEFDFLEVKENETKFTITILNQSLSYLFQYTLGPILYFLNNQKLQNSLFLLRMVLPY